MFSQEKRPIAIIHSLLRIHRHKQWINRYKKTKDQVNQAIIIKQNGAIDLQLNCLVLLSCLVKKVLHKVIFSLAIKNSQTNKWTFTGYKIANGQMNQAMLR